MPRLRPHHVNDEESGFVFYDGQHASSVFNFLMLAQLEDDVETKAGYVRNIRQFITQNDEKVADFSYLIVRLIILMFF